MNDTLYRIFRRRFVRWYMGRVAGRYCPCEWKPKFLQSHWPMRQLMAIIPSRERAAGGDAA